MYMWAYLCLPKHVSIYSVHFYYYKLASSQGALWTKCLCLPFHALLPHPHLYVEAVILNVVLFGGGTLGSNRMKSREWRPHGGIGTPIRGYTNQSSLLVI